MRPRLLAASAVGLLFNGVVLLRLIGSVGVPALARTAAVGGEVGLALLVPRAAQAKAPESHGAAEFRAIAVGPASDDVPVSAPVAVKEPISACPASMILVEGEYCPDVRHECRHWLEETGKYAYYRCEDYSGATCLSKERVHKRFCMDRDEYVPPGEKLPSSHKSWNDAKKTCGAEGKRVCMESEWNFACEGEEMRPYPYGWKRDPDACNADLTDIYRADGKLRDLRVGADDKPRCVSPFGVHNLSGNLEEFVTIDGSSPNEPRPAMKGAYWQPSRNHCRAAQTAHDRFYNGTETGFRCCSDPN
jgi:hypothetical protein